MATKEAPIEVDATVESSTRMLLIVTDVLLSVPRLPSLLRKRMRKAVAARCMIMCAWSSFSSRSFSTSSGCLNCDSSCQYEKRGEVSNTGGLDAPAAE